MEKGSFQPGPSGDLRESPECGKTRRIRISSRDSSDFCEKTRFVMTPLYVPGYQRFWGVKRAPESGTRSTIRELQKVSPLSISEP